MDKSINIITDLDGNKVVLIHDLRFKSRNDINWNQVEQYLKEYIGEYFEITETAEKIFIGKEFPDYNKKHKSKAKYGWYRYDTRFGLPVYDEQGNLERYNIFSTRMLVRCDEDGKLYLYALVRTKKETSRPLEQ